jgi:hypothetical protein
MGINIDELCEMFNNGNIPPVMPQPRMFVHTAYGGGLYNADFDGDTPPQSPNFRAKRKKSGPVIEEIDDENVPIQAKNKSVKITGGDLMHVYDELRQLRQEISDIKILLLSLCANKDSSDTDSNAGSDDSYSADSDNSDVCDAMNRMRINNLYSESNNTSNID